MVGDVRTLAKSFERYLRATNRSPRRVETYLEAYLLDERELDGSAMANMALPQVPEQPVPVLGEDDLKKLLADCSGSAFEDRRDQARPLGKTALAWTGICGPGLAILTPRLPWLWIQRRGRVNESGSPTMLKRGKRVGIG